jgi:hypothetical protein
LNTDRIGAAFSLPFPRFGAKPAPSDRTAPFRVRPDRTGKPPPQRRRTGDGIGVGFTLPSQFPVSRFRFVDFCPTGARRTRDFCAAGAGACPLARGGSSTTDAAPTNTVPKPPILVHVVFTHPPYPLCVVFTNERRNGTANRPDLAFERRQHTAERSSWVGNTNDPP